MSKGEYLRLAHFVPDGYPPVYPGSSSEVKEMMPFLIEKVPKGWTKVPNHELEVIAIRRNEVPSLGFRKKGKEVYVHVFCNEFMNPINALQIVLTLYKKFNLGKPVFTAEEPNWIHTIPLPGADLTQAETLLIHQLTQAMFWTIYMDYERSKGGPT